MAHNIPSLRTHHPIGRDSDVLGYWKFAEAICEQLSNLKSQHMGLTIGVFGDWGVGKSSVLRMTSERLKHFSATDRFLVVEFDAWRYTKQEELWLALLRKITREIRWQLGFSSLFRVNLELWWTHVESSNLLGVMWQTVRALFTTLTGKLDIALPSISAPFGLRYGTGKSIDVDDFLADFRTMIKAAEKQIVVLIDDLDRCPEDQVVPVLEAIKHLGFHDLDDRQATVKYNLLYGDKNRFHAALDRWIDTAVWPNEPPPLSAYRCVIPTNIAFVLAADKRAIQRAVHIYYKEYHEIQGFDAERFAREYVEKIVQIPFELPRVPSIDMSKLLAAKS